MLSAIYARLTPSIFGKSELHRLILQRSFLESSLLTFEFQMDDNMHYEHILTIADLFLDKFVILCMCQYVICWPRPKTSKIQKETWSAMTWVHRCLQNVSLKSRSNGSARKLSLAIRKKRWFALEDCGFHKENREVSNSSSNTSKFCAAVLNPYWTLLGMMISCLHT